MRFVVVIVIALLFVSNASAFLGGMAEQLAQAAAAAKAAQQAAAEAAMLAPVTVPATLKCYMRHPLSMLIFRPYVFELEGPAKLAPNGTLLVAVRRQTACPLTDNSCTDAIFTRRTLVGHWTRIAAMQDITKRYAVVQIGCCTVDPCVTSASGVLRPVLGGSTLPTLPVANPPIITSPASPLPATQVSPTVNITNGSNTSTDASPSSNTGTTPTTMRNSTDSEDIRDAADTSINASSNTKPVTTPSGGATGGADNGATEVASASYVPVFLSDGTYSATQKLGPNSAKSTMPGTLALVMTLLTLLGYAGLL